MNNVATARPLSVHTPRSMRVYRPVNARQSANQDLHFSSVFNPLTAQDMLSQLVKQLMGEINTHVVATSTVDKSGVSLVLSCDDYQLSVIFNDMKGQCNG